MVDGANQHGTLLKTDGWWPGTKLRRGETFMVLGDFKRHPVRGDRYLTQRIQVRADCEADRVGRLSIPVDELTKLTINNGMLLPARRTT